MDLLSGSGGTDRRAAVVLGALGMALLCGCDLFTPATPEPPAGGQIFVPDYSDPARTLKTMARALELRKEQSAYLGGLADSILTTDQPFSARMDPADVAEVPPGTPIPQRWDKSLERNFYSYLVTVPRDTVFYMLFESIPSLPDSTGVDQQVLHRSYTLFAGVAAGDTAARGQADLRFIKVAGQQWRVLLWVDHRDPNANPNLHTFGWFRLISQ